MTDKTDTIDTLDDINLNLARTKAILNSITFNQNIATMNNDDVEILLAVIYESVDKVDVSIKELGKVFLSKN